MGIPIRIDENIYYEAKKVAVAEFRWTGDSNQGKRIHFGFNLFCSL